MHDSDLVYSQILAVQALATECKKKHRGDGLAAPALLLCEMLLEGHPGHAPELGDSDGGTGDSDPGTDDGVTGDGDPVPPPMPNPDPEGGDDSDPDENEFRAQNPAEVLDLGKSDDPDA